MKPRHHFEVIYRHKIEKLRHGLDSSLTYHNADHTILVVKRAAFIALKEGATKEDIHLLQLAALYHDAGFMVSREGHEAIGCEMARKDMASFGYAAEDIEIVCRLIVVTDRGAEPKNLMEKIILDADVEYIGSAHYDRISQGLFKELRMVNPDFTALDWMQTQINFLSKHRFYTQYCKRYREFRKKKQLSTIRAQYELATGKKGTDTEVTSGL
ncbi:MAG: HD domain-containing protein [Saprospiraceae bacterium]|nr:HD domain-containing protein [Saprospiraceae bacterium]